MEEIQGATSPAPWVLLDLPERAYEVLAGFKGETQTRTVTVRAGRVQEHTFVF